MRHFRVEINIFFYLRTNVLNCSSNCSKMPGRRKIINSVSSDIKTTFCTRLLRDTITVIQEGCYCCMRKLFILLLFILMHGCILQ